MPSSRIVYYDGTSEVITHHVVDMGDSSPLIERASMRARFMNFMACVLNFPFWLPNLAFHALVRLQGAVREGLLVDCGAVSNLAGSKWVARSSALAAAHGQGTRTVEVAGQSVEGVGTGSSKITKRSIVPVCLSNGLQGTFESSVIEDSELPALMGLETLERNRAIIDVANKRLIYVGAGGYELKLSPGSVTMLLEKVPSGHLLLPSAEWSALKPSTGKPLQH